MFVSLKALMGQCVSLAMTITAAPDDRLTVTVIPKPKLTGDEAQALSTPLQLTGTAEELDKEFVGLISSFSESHKSLAEQVEATTSVLEAAKKTSQGKAVKAVTKSSDKSAKGEKPAPEEDSAPAGSSESDEKGTEAGGASEASPPPPPPPPPAEDATKAGSENLWG